MKKVTLGLILAAAVLTGFWSAGPALAFHGGGVAHCDGCHSMHNSPDNPIGAGATANDTLMKGTDPSSTCLNCHAGNDGYHIASTDQTKVNYNAGGDFYWLKNDYTHVVRGNPVTQKGESFGHNIVAADFGYTADTTNAQAPGGTYSAALLGCNSCHDPHGKVGGAGQGPKAPNSAPISGSGSSGAANPGDGSILGNYRLLGGIGYDGGEGANANFTNGAPVARALNVSGAGNHYSEKVDYGSGMSEWCANCHGTIHANANGTLHPAGNAEKLPLAYVNAYNSYVATGNSTGVVATAYDALVPIERGVSDRTLLDANSTVGATAGQSNVMCLTCHRAHASGFENMIRWETSEEFIKNHHPTTGDGGYTLTDGNAAYYKNGASVDIATVYGTYQRSLCNKCHVQD